MVFTISPVNQPYVLSYRLSTPSCRSAETIDPAYPTVLFTHPPWADSFFFYPQFDDPLFNQNYNLLAIDLPAHGSSYFLSPQSKTFKWEEAAETLYQALETLKINPVHVVGSSSGGLAALRLALGHPEVVESLILVAPPVEKEPEPVRIAFEEWLESFAEAVAAKDMESVDILNRAVFDFFVGSSGDPAMREMEEEYAQMVKSKFVSGKIDGDALILRTLLDARREIPSLEEMQKLTCPVLFLEPPSEWTESYQLDTYAEVVEKLNESCFGMQKPANAVRHQLEGVSSTRWITLINPDPVNFIITQFLRTKSPDSLPPSPNTPLTPCVARRPSTPRDVSAFTILPPPRLSHGKKTLGEMMDEMEMNGHGVNVEVAVEVVVEISGGDDDRYSL